MKPRTTFSLFLLSRVPVQHTAFTSSKYFTLFIMVREILPWWKHVTWLVACVRPATSKEVKINYKDSFLVLTFRNGNHVWSGREPFEPNSKIVWSKLSNVSIVVNGHVIWWTVPFALHLVDTVREAWYQRYLVDTDTMQYALVRSLKLDINYLVTVQYALVCSLELDINSIWWIRSPCNTPWFAPLRLEILHVIGSFSLSSAAIC